MPPEEHLALLEGKVLALEDRVRLLEAKLRELNALGRQADEAAKAAKGLRAARTRPRPRCPGCTL